MAIFKKDGQVFSWHSKNKKTEYANRHGPKIFASTRNSLELVETLTISDLFGFTVSSDNRYLFASWFVSYSGNSSSELRRYTLGTDRPYNMKTIMDYGSASAFPPLYDSEGNIVFSKQGAIYKKTMDGVTIASVAVSTGSNVGVSLDLPDSNQYLVYDAGYGNLFLYNRDTLHQDVKVSMSSGYHSVYSDGMIGIALNDNLTVLNATTLKQVTSVSTGGQNSAVGLAVVKDHYFVFSSTAIQIYELLNGKLTKIKTINYPSIYWNSAKSDGRFVYFDTVTKTSDGVKSSVYKLDYDGNEVMNQATDIVGGAYFDANATDIYIWGVRDGSSATVIQHYHQF